MKVAAENFVIYPNINLIRIMLQLYRLIMGYDANYFVVFVNIMRMNIKTLKKFWR